MSNSVKTQGCWKTLGRIVISVAIFVTLGVAFYSEENWRGKRDWENYKHQLESEGVVMDWKKLLPAPVADDENFFKASPEMQHLFVRFPSDPNAATNTFVPRYAVPNTQAPTNLPILDTAKTGPITVADISVLPTTTSGFQGADARVLKLGESDITAKAHQIIQVVLGDTTVGAQGFKFTALHLDQVKPAHIIVQADALLTERDMEQLLAVDAITNLGRLRVEKTDADANKFHLLLVDTKVIAAEDYLQWCRQYDPFFDDVRQALKRPYAEINWGLDEPYNMPVPNFVAMRVLAQMLAQRAQCYLLLEQPDAALRELNLLYDSRHILMQEPTGKPLTLVAAMINVAIASVYVTPIAEGIRSHLWTEPQLKELQEQLRNIDLPPLVNESFQEEIVFCSETFEKTSIQRLQDIYPKSSWKIIFNRNWLVLNLGPRGWGYQNVKRAVALQTEAFTGIDPEKKLFFPKRIRQSTDTVERTLRHWSPWNIWSAIWVANFNKAKLRTAENQTLVNETQIACALERYRLVHGNYPSALADLVPQFIDSLPHDIIGGQPLHYRRADDGKFLLYSIGWNEKDDGGLKDPRDEGNGDWVW